MIRMTPAFRISIGLMLFTVTLLLGLDMAGLFPEPFKAELEMRKKVCESLAIYGSLAIQKDELESIQSTMEVFVHRNKDVLSAALRSATGTLLAKVGDHERYWNESRTDQSSATNINVPIFKDNIKWGVFELSFRPIHPKGVLGIWAKPVVKVIVLIIPLTLLGFWLFMRRTLRYLDPSSVVPARVKSALDALVEGVVLLDKGERIVLANAAFSKKLGLSGDDLLGRKASELNWTHPKSHESPQDYPWRQAIIQGEHRHAVPLAIQTGKGGPKTFMVHGAPILDDGGKTRGALATFDDITQLEAKNDELQEMLTRLEKSRDEVRQQNQQLQVLATQDPLTRCLNRRSFFERIEMEYSRAKRYGHELSCMMIDIDHFKKINDTYGHQVGDRVLQEMAEKLKSTLRDSDILCRYGGEEFCVILPHIGPGDGLKAGERIRAAIASSKIQGVAVRASFGVSSLGLGAANPQELIGQADLALYTAKKEGRNRVVQWERGQAHATKQGDLKAPPSIDSVDEKEVHIPHHIVSALMTAMAHRDMETAEHSRLVADLCMASAQGLMPLNQCYVLEVAGELHDIGKLGVPDSILLKPGALTDEEWQVIREHKRRSVELISSTFLSPQLVEIVRFNHAWYGGTQGSPDFPTGKDIPLGSRILAIADAFSSMVSHRPYRPARSYEEAFSELRRFAGEQFDPDLVEHFIGVVQARSETRQEKTRYISNAIKLEIGREVEQVFTAVNTSAYGMLGPIADRLANKAARNGLNEIAEVAKAIEKASQEKVEQLRILRLASELQKACESIRREEPEGEEIQTSLAA